MTVPLSSVGQQQLSDLDEIYRFVLDLIISVAKSLNFKSPSKVKTKAHRKDFVTESDQEVQRLIINGLSDQYPDHEFISEEQYSDGDLAELTDAPTWIIDPIDGTMNLVHMYPFFTISVALYVNKVAEIGIIYNPTLNLCYKARRNLGAKLNEDKIKVSGQRKLNKALLMFEFGAGVYRDRFASAIENAKTLVPQAHGIRSTGSAAMNCCFVASGAADAFCHSGTRLWDVAAGALIVREAGGYVMDPDGKDFDILSRRILVAATPDLGFEIAKTITQYYPRPRDDEKRTSELDEVLLEGARASDNSDDDDDDDDDDGACQCDTYEMEQSKNNE